MTVDQLKKAAEMIANCAEMEGEDKEIMVEDIVLLATIYATSEIDAYIYGSQASLDALTMDIH